MNERFKLLNEAKASGDPVKWSQYRKKKEMRLKKIHERGPKRLIGMINLTNQPILKNLEADKPGAKEKQS